MNCLVPPVKRFLPDGKPASAFPLDFSFTARGRNARLAANYLTAGEMGREFGVRARQASGGRADLQITVERGLLRDVRGLPAGRDIRDQTYRLIWRPGRVAAILAENAQGAFYGAVTLRQILASQAEGCEIPAGTVEDWPALQWRGLQDDLARGRTFNLDHAKRQVRHLAEMKGNLYQLYLETRFAFPRRPDAGLPGSMTPDDARALEAYAASLGVTLLPQVNTFAHMELLLSKKSYAHLREKADDPFVICPLHPETRPLLRDLLNDIMDAFQTPLIPVGLDEITHFCACKRCRKKSAADLLLDHVKFLHDVVTRRGRRMLVWHDMFLDRVQFAGNVANGSHDWAERVLNALPRDIIICDWQYTASGDTTHYFTGKGFDAMACNYVWGASRGDFPFDFDAAWHTSRFFAQAHRAGAIGAIQTTWGDSISDPFENRWFLYAHSLSTAWEPAQRIILHRMADNWARIEMGIPGKEFEDFFARLSVPLFGGTGLAFVTAEETRHGAALFRFARAWWQALGPGLVRYEKRYIRDLLAKLRKFRRTARRGCEYLALMDYPVTLRQIHLDEAVRVGRAARLYKQAARLKPSDKKRRDLLREAGDLLLAHAGGLEVVAAALRRIADSQGVAESEFKKLRDRRREIRSRAGKLAGKRLPSFEDVFWRETATPYGR